MPLREDVIGRLKRIAHAHVCFLADFEGMNGKEYMWEHTVDMKISDTDNGFAKVSIRVDGRLEAVFAIRVNESDEE